MAPEITAEVIVFPERAPETAPEMAPEITA